MPVMPDLVYKLAQSDDELKGALAVRREVFIREQKVPQDEEYDEYDKTALHLVVKDSKRIIATARLVLISPGEARIGRMCILKPYRRQGIGQKMLDTLIDEARRHGIKEVMLHAQWAAIPFYRAYGFEASGQPFREAGIKHIKMEKRL